MKNLHLSDILSKPFDNDVIFRDEIVNTIKQTYQKQLKTTESKMKFLTEEIKELEKEKNTTK